MELLSASDTGVGGYKEVSFLIKGKGAYSRLKYESGVHRVQRIPSTNQEEESIHQRLQLLFYQKLKL